jgi:cell division protein FtsN
MAKIEPGAFKASDDVRVFDDIDDGEGEEGSRLPLLIVIALLVLAAFGGVVWLAYNQGVQKGRADAPRPLMAQTQTPSQNKGIKVYEQPAPPDGDTSEEDTAPPPSAVKPPSAMAQTQTPPPATVVQATPKPVVTAPPPAPAETVPTPTPKPQQLAVATPKPAPAKIKPVPPEDTLVATPPPAAATGEYVLQIGAYKSQDEADAAWKSYQHKHAMLGSYSSDVKQVDLGEKGTWYRLRVGAFSKDAASSLCTKLKADGGDCLLAKK